MSRKDQITRGLHEIGACWAVTARKCVLPNDGSGAKPSYHVHPDRTYPHEANILRFASLDEIARYIQARREAATLDEERAYARMQEFWASLA